MDIRQFSRAEQSSLLSDYFDDKQDIHAYHTKNSNTYIVKCKNLPLGDYMIRSKHVHLCSANEGYGRFSFGPELSQTNQIFINVTGPVGEIVFQISKCKNIGFIIRHLRIQALSNKYQNNSLIKKEIKRNYASNNKTNFGKAYNLRSLYDTVQECLDEDITIELDESKPMTDLDVRYLRAMKLMQDKKRIDAKQKALDMEKEALRQREIEFMKR